MGRAGIGGNQTLRASREDREPGPKGEPGKWGTCLLGRARREGKRVVRASRESGGPAKLGEPGTSGNQAAGASRNRWETGIVGEPVSGGTSPNGRAGSNEPAFLLVMIKSIYSKVCYFCKHLSTFVNLLPLLYTSGRPGASGSRALLFRICLPVYYYEYIISDNISS